MQKQDLAQRAKPAALSETVPAMPKFLISLIRPDGYKHTDAFREIAETLQFGLRSIGHQAEILENTFDCAATNVILGAHLLSPEEMRMVPEGSIIYNLEQIGGAQLRETYYQLARQHRIWDYDVSNLDKWKALNCCCEPIHVPIGYVPELTRISRVEPQDIDVLFYGSLNERRNKVLNQLKELGVAVHTAFGVYGQERDALIARSKVVLNVHFYETKIFEIARISYLLANSKAVVTECDGNTAAEHGLAEGMLALPYQSLVEGCVFLLQHGDERRDLESRGFHAFSKRKESEILSTALQQTTTPATSSSPAVLPRKLNLGSGKDWRQDYFNVDIDAYWEPDAVMDFGSPLPIGKPLETSRFGTLLLENNYFEEIITNDVLEHIPNLMGAMTSCLKLLRVGGVFKIAVPYDLSWGAWQDPTHVRAFNERSWLYYTDWFWYMGWTEARFDIVGFELGLSAIGEKLKQQNMKGEEIARYPRAVDQMRVTLRKRLLTEAEKGQVLKYLQRPSRRAAAPSPPSPIPSVSLPHITQTSSATNSPLTSYVQAAFSKANIGQGQIDPAVLEIDGMSGRKYRLFINNLIASMADARYLEIGTWAGSTLCSAINRNTVNATAIDNWSEFGGPKAQFLNNLQRFQTGSAKVAFLENDFRKIDYTQLGTFNVYMFDGPHTAADQFDGISLVLPALEDEFILIVDDWNHTPAREGTLKALKELKLSVLHAYEIRTTLDGSHPTIARQSSDWHNGYLIAVIAKPREKETINCAQHFRVPAATVETLAGQNQ